MHNKTVIKLNKMNKTQKNIKKQLTNQVDCCLIGIRKRLSKGELNKQRRKAWFP